MYICSEHGELTNEFCNDCSKIVNCNCKDTEQKRVKDICIETNKGERCVTVYFTVCESCGNIISVNL